MEYIYGVCRQREKRGAMHSFISKACLRKYTWTLQRAGVVRDLGVYRACLCLVWVKNVDAVSLTWLSHTNDDRHALADAAWPSSPWPPHQALLRTPSSTTWLSHKRCPRNFGRRLRGLLKTRRHVIRHCDRLVAAIRYWRPRGRPEKQQKIQ